MTESSRLSPYCQEVTCLYSQPGLIYDNFGVNVLRFCLPGMIQGVPARIVIRPITGWRYNGG